MSDLFEPRFCDSYAGAAAPFAFTDGPRDAKIMLLGEAHGKDEEITGLPFFGSAGQELTRMLADAGIERGQCFISNTFAFRPPENKLDHLWIGTKEAKALGATLLPPMQKGKFLHPIFYPELNRLRAEIREVGPNIIVALGATAAWATLCVSGITAVRGACALGDPRGVAPGRKILPTFHPASVLRQWDQRVIVVTDFRKALRQSEFPELRRPQRTITIDPSIEQVRDFAARAAHFVELSVDIETEKGQISTIGFAPTKREAFVVPFVDWRNPTRSYWTDWQEREVWLLVKAILEAPSEKTFQNGLYDLQYILPMTIRPRNCKHDTMLFHHALFPELPKGLGFLGAAHTDEISWKTLRGFKSNDMNKREE